MLQTKKKYADESSDGKVIDLFSDYSSGGTKRIKKQDDDDDIQFTDNETYDSKKSG